MALTVFILLVVVFMITYRMSITYLMARQDAHLARDPVTGILKGAEPVFLKGNNSAVCLLIHGFIGSPTDFGRLPGLLHEKGYTVAVPLLPGHGTDPRNFARVKPEDLIRFVKSVIGQLKQQHNDIILIGMSMGGALATIAASEPKVRKLILIAPYFKIKHRWFYILPTEWWNRILSPFLPFVYRPRYFKQVFNQDAVPHIIDYNFTSTRGAETAFHISKDAAGKAGNIHVPTLVIQSKKDRATDYKASMKIAGKLPQGLVKTITLERSNHLILWDFELEIVENEILKFVEAD